MLTRGYIGSAAAAGSGITEEQHAALDTFLHNLSEDAYTEFAYSGNDLVSVVTWTDAGKALKIREATLGYSGDDLTSVVVVQYDGGGVAAETLTKTLSYLAGELQSVTTVRT